MSSLKLFGFPFERCIGIIANIHMVLIFSVILSIAIDVYNIDESSKVELNYSSTVLLIHSFGFFFYQIVYLLVGRFLLNCVNSDNYGIIGVFEFLQTYSIILYFHNPFIRPYWECCERLYVLFKYTTMAQKYSVYLFLSLSIITFFVLVNSHNENDIDKKKNIDSKKVFWLTRDTLESVINRINNFSFIPIAMALQTDFVLIINSPTLQEPTYYQVMALIHYAVMIIYQYFRFLSQISLLTLAKRSWVYSQLIQLVLFLVYFVNPYRQTDKEVLGFFKYTTLAQSFCIPILLGSFIFNSLVYYQLSNLNASNLSTPIETNENYNLTDHCEKSSTKNEIHEHPNHWLKRKPYLKK